MSQNWGIITHCHKMNAVVQLRLATDSTISVAGIWTIKLLDDEIGLDHRPQFLPRELDGNRIVRTAARRGVVPEEGPQVGPDPPRPQDGGEHADVQEDVVRGVQEEDGQY